MLRFLAAGNIENANILNEDPIGNWNFKDNIHRYILIIFSLTVIMFFQFIGIPIAIIGYLVLSLIFIKQ